MGFSHCTNIWFLDKNLNVGIVNSQWWCTTRGTGSARALAPVEFCASCNLDQCLHPLLTAALYKMILTNVALVRIGFKLLVCWEFPKQSRVTIKRFCQEGSFTPGACTQFWANLTLKSSIWWVWTQACCATCLRPAETIAVGHGSCVHAGSCVTPWLYQCWGAHELRLTTEQMRTWQ